jgi:hypothetical protein
MPALDVNCARDFVTTIKVAEELIDKITAVRVVPEMMMGIADQKIRLDDFLWHWTCSSINHDG